MKLKRIEYKDKKGRKYMVEVPEGYEDMPQTGIRLGPPDLESLNLPLKYEVALNNQLYDRQLFTPADVRRRPDEIKAALYTVFKVDALQIRNLYLTEVKDA